MVGGRNYADSQFNRAVAAKRQPGSSFKPFVYLAALEKGLTPDTVREDAPISVKGWNPENYSPRIFRPGDADQGAVAVAQHRRGAAWPRGRAEGGGRRSPTGSASRPTSIPSPRSRSASSEVTPLEMVSAYAAFANGGIGVQPHVIARVRTADGKLLYARRNASFGRVIDPQYVAMMNEMMQETLLTGTARKAELPGWQAAGKTGTSQDWRDAWFIGYTSYLVAGVWLGNDDDSPTKKVSGGNLPVEIWSRFMRAAHEGVPVAGLPLGAWRNAETPNPDAPLLPPLDLTGRAGADAPAGRQRRRRFAARRRRPKPSRRRRRRPARAAPLARPRIRRRSRPLRSRTSRPRDDRSALGKLLGTM